MNRARFCRATPLRVLFLSNLAVVIQTSTTPVNEIHLKCIFHATTDLGITRFPPFQLLKEIMLLLSSLVINSSVCFPIFRGKNVKALISPYSPSHTNGCIFCLFVCSSWLNCQNPCKWNSLRFQLICLVSLRSCGVNDVVPTIALSGQMISFVVL